jgi:hypothetical protein
MNVSAAFCGFEFEINAFEMSQISFHGPPKILSYYKHQKWEDGRNRSCRVPAEEAKALREALEGRQRFESLIAEFIELTVASTRKADHSKQNSARSSRRRVAAKRPPS